jgi:hypothetical protein
MALLKKDLHDLKNRGLCRFRGEKLLKIGFFSGASHSNSDPWQRVGPSGPSENSRPDFYAHEDRNLSCLRLSAAKK